MSAREALLQEFSSYYQADELPTFLYDGLDQRVDGSARRLARRLGDDSGQASALLREAAADRAHSFIEEIEDATVYGWTGDDEDWILSRHLVLRLADGIDGASARAE